MTVRAAHSLVPFLHTQSSAVIQSVYALNHYGLKLQAQMCSPKPRVASLLSLIFLYGTMYAANMYNMAL